MQKNQLKYGPLVLLMTFVILITSCQKRQTANFNSSKHKSGSIHKKPTRKDINDCHIMEKKRDKADKSTAKIQKRIAKRNKREAKWEAQGKTAKLERNKKLRAKNEELYGPGYATDWSFLLVIGLVIGGIAIGIVFLVSIAITFIISLALSTFFVPFAFALLGFVFSAVAMGAFHLFKFIQNLFQRRRRRRKKKKEEEELNQEQYSNE